MSNKILIIEDNKDIRDNIKEYLELEDYIIDTAANGEIGLDKAVENNYDLILLDLMLPLIDGYTVARKLSQKKDTPIIMVTAKNSIEDKLEGFKKGAIDYIVKPFDLRELDMRIKAHLKLNKSDIIESGDLLIDLKKREFKKEGELVNLSTKEFQLFEIIHENKDKVISRTDIIEYIWGESEIFDADPKLDVYISTLRKKLGKSVIETVKGVGYKYGL